MEPDELNAAVGHPQIRWDALLARVQADHINRFGTVEDDWLALMWCLDQYRIAGVAPTGMGKSSLPVAKRLAAVYRMKGNWFALLIAALLQNRTSQPIAAKNRVVGFSQPHQVDVAWPPREDDPLICIETKVTGAPGYGDTPTRSAMGDFSNRRKELKFAATDLKLFRRQDETSINHWGAWRSSAPPRTYFLWAARLRTDRNPDSVITLAREAQALVDTYLDGAGILAWRQRGGGGYERVDLPIWARVSVLDDVLYRVASEISQMAPTGRPPEPFIPTSRSVDIDELIVDRQEE
jgi:hypothetical protein